MKMENEIWKLLENLYSYTTLQLFHKKYRTGLSDV